MPQLPSSTQQRQAEMGCPSLHGTPGSLKSPPFCSPSITDVGRALHSSAPVSPTRAPAKPFPAGWRGVQGRGRGKLRPEETWSAAQVGTGLCPPQGGTPLPAEDTFLPSGLHGEGIIPEITPWNPGQPGIPGQPSTAIPLWSWCQCLLLMWGPGLGVSGEDRRFLGSGTQGTLWWARVRGHRALLPTFTKPGGPHQGS